MRGCILIAALTFAIPPVLQLWIWIAAASKACAFEFPFVMSTTTYSPRRSRQSTGWSVLRRLLGVVLLLVLGWFVWLYFQINAVAHRDEARPSDAIAVFGAAEYLGRPSPVLHARLDHAVELYRKQIGPVGVTLGGGTN